MMDITERSIKFQGMGYLSDKLHMQSSVTYFLMSCHKKQDQAD